MRSLIQSVHQAQVSITEIVEWSFLRVIDLTLSIAYLKIEKNSEAILFPKQQNTRSLLQIQVLVVTIYLMIIVLAGLNDHQLPQSTFN